MDSTTLIEWLKFGWLLLGPLMIFLHNMFSQKMKTVEAENKVTADAVTALAEKQAKSIGEIRDRMAAVDATLKHTPSKDEVHKLQLQVTELCGDFKALNKGVSNISASVSRIETYLLKEVSK